MSDKHKVVCEECGGRVVAMFNETNNFEVYEKDNDLEVGAFAGTDEGCGRTSYWCESCEVEIDLDDIKILDEPYVSSDESIVQIPYGLVSLIISDLQFAVCAYEDWIQDDEDATDEDREYRAACRDEVLERIKFIQKTMGVEDE